MTLDPQKLRELVEAWEDAKQSGDWDAIKRADGGLADFMIARSRELLAVVEAQGWRTIDQHTPKGIWLECRRPSLTHPSGYWIAMLIYSDGHWLDTSGAAFEPHEYRLPLRARTRRGDCGESGEGALFEPRSDYLQARRP